MRVAIWQNRRFRLFWTGDTISAAGGALSTVAIPLLAIETLHATDAEVGALRAAQTLPFMLLALPIGWLADRVSRRRLLLYADLLRVPVMALTALVALPMNGLVALVFVAGIGAVAYEVAYLSALPELVDGPSDLPDANRAVETAHASAALLGPAAGGALVAALSAAGTVALDAVSFAIGATLTAINRWPSPSSRDRRRAAPGGPPREHAERPAGESLERPTGESLDRSVAESFERSVGEWFERPVAESVEGPAGELPDRALREPVDDQVPKASTDRAGVAPGSRMGELAGGLVWLRGNAPVRAMTLYLAANNLALQAFQTALLLFVTATVARPALAVGFALAAAGAGFLAGAAVSPPLARRLGTGPVVIAASLLGALGIGLAAVSSGFALVLAGAAVAGAGSGLFNLHSIAVRQAVTPAELLGRVNAVVKTASYGATTLGALFGGLVAAVAGPRPVIAGAALVSAAATLFLTGRAVRSLR